MTSLYSPPQNGGSEVTLGSLDSIYISQSWVDPKGTQTMLNAIDFTKLSEIELHYVGGPVSHLFKPLEEAFIRASTNRSGIRLRKLVIGAEFEHEQPQNHAGESEAAIENARFAFLSSFSDLTWLEISNYGMHPQPAWEPGEEPDRQPTFGVPDVVINAILQHSRLKTLKLTNRSGTNWLLTYLSPANLDSLITGLPELEHFHFYPYEWTMVRLRTSGSCKACH